MAIYIHAYYGGSKTGRKRDRPKMLRVFDQITGDEQRIVADSTDMTRLWRKVRNWQGDASVLDGD